MTLLPIAARELRVAARKRSTFWVRVATAITAVVISGAFMLMAVFSFGFGTANFGSALFATLTWLSVAAVLAAGLFFTSDCLSEEKREGTIGFLFLTDLRGYDVVLGKLLATSLRGFYAFMAIFPIFAITLLMGGVTGAQFWKTMVALVSALFLSLTIGMFISAVSRDAQKALAGTLIALVLLSATGPIVDSIVSKMQSSPFVPLVSLSSPIYVFAISGTWGPSPFWTGLLVNQVVAWAMLAFTSLLLPRAWQEKGRSSEHRHNWIYRWRFGGANRRTAVRIKLLARNPVLWLASRERWQAVALWLVCFLTAGAAVALFFANDDIQVWLGWSYLGGLVTLVLYLVVASQAGRFFVYAKRSGLLELLLVTPLSGIQIVHGQWRALLRIFAIPVVLYLATQLFASTMAHQAYRNLAASIPATPVPPATIGSTNLTQTNATTLVVTTGVVITTPGGPVPVATGAASDGPGWIMTTIVGLIAVLATAANLMALWWFGMWMGLTSRSANLATLKTLLFVQVIPWFVMMFAGWMIVPLMLLPKLFAGNSPGAMITWFPLISSAFGSTLALSKDIGYIVWSRSRLHTQLRERAADISNYVPPPIIPTATASAVAAQP